MNTDWLLPITRIIIHILYWLISAGFEQHVYVTSVPDKHDGPADNDGPAATGRWPHGREDHVCHANVQEGETEDGGIRLSESHHNAFAR